MFIIDLTYKVHLNQINQYLEDHIQYLEHQYELGNFQTSGKKVPRTGGIILSTLADKITEFIPSKTNEDFKFLLK